MHDLATIQRMNAEATDRPFEAGDRVTIVNTPYHEGRRGTISYIDDDPGFPVRVEFGDSGGWFARSELEHRSTPEQIAQAVLDNHCIHDDWKRTGAQIRELLIEAVKEARA